MFFPEGTVRVHLYGEPVDMRRSFDGLYALTKHKLRCDPLSGGLFVFINRRGTQMKVLYWDRTGFCVWAKRLDAAAQWTAEQGVELSRSNVALRHELDTLKYQLEWFKRQIFGTKSEKRLLPPNPSQLTLGELPIPESAPDVPGKPIAGHTRRAPITDFAKDGADDGLFFDDQRVPVETIQVPAPEVEGLSPEQYEVIGEKVSHRLAQRPGSYVVLKYVRPVVKRRDTEAIHCAPAPVGVIEGSRADVSFVVGLLLDKFLWHLPLYRQHLRLTDAGIRVSRAWLTQLGAKASALLEPIYTAQLASIRSSRVKAMDETPIKAGRAGPGKIPLSQNSWCAYRI